jgi:predicted heme/steroid binding protein
MAQEREYTLDELAQYNGEGDKDKILISIAGNGML